MGDRFIKTPVAGYISELSARSMVPGGGSASALAACLGAGLNLMVINFSMGKNMPDKVTSVMKVFRDKQQEILESLEGSVDGDCEAFTELMKALSDGTPSDEKYIRAAKEPLNVCRKSLESLEITGLIAKDCNKNLMTDVISAAHMLRASFWSARVNVEINLPGIKDAAFVSVVRKELEIMAEKIAELHGNVTSGTGVF
ncbi:MAG: cyclodeaminase/cyclohydrolase family protein [Candidatus Omnitrophica bacterium]|nr:cyclodeaminase/cyclohydrolase family protein [Candidatus Omnitrophota bacterium]MDD5488641.1 cyclodeaminase/cyclohydrolase family protein [Candidatus Omnitrophota bacterium]